MPLPGILPPSDLPPFLIAGHAAAYGNPYANIAMTTGEHRRRRVVTVRPQMVAASFLLERSQMSSFQIWFRDTLRSGERRFSANVKEQGAGMLWYESAFADMYRATALHLGRWRVDMQLMLFGDGEAEAPFTGMLATSITLDLTGSGSLRVPIQLRTQINLPLLQSLSLRTRIQLDLEE